MGEQTGPFLAAPDTVEAFAHDLNELRGELTFKKLSKDAGYAIGSLHNAIKGEKLPTEAVLLAFVGACGADEAEQVQWRQRRKLLADAGSGTDKELARAQAEIGRLGNELERLRQVVDDPETSAYQAERRLADAQAAEERARKNLQELTAFADGLKAQIAEADAEAGKVRREVAEETATQKADLVARGAAAARTAQKIIEDAEALRESAAAEARRIRAEAAAEAERMREQAQAEIVQITSDARATAIAEARALVLSEADRQRDLAVRTAQELIFAAGDAAQSAETGDERPSASGSEFTVDEASAMMDDARKRAEEIVERAKFQADTIRRVAIQDSAALQAKHAELLTAVEALERRASRLSGPPEQARPAAGRHRRRPSGPSPVPKHESAPPSVPPGIPAPVPASRSAPTGAPAEALVRQLELNLLKYMKELAQARKSRDLAKVRVAEGALDRCRNSLAEARAAVDRKRDSVDRSAPRPRNK